MVAAAPPRIFARNRVLAIRRRMLTLQTRDNAPHYLIDDMVEDVLDRIAFVRLAPCRALVIGDFTGKLAAALAAAGTHVTSADPADGFDEEQPYPTSDFQLVASLGTLDRVNDLPGALIHIRHGLAPGGMMIASFPGAGCLPTLRQAMLAADGDRPAPRIHPQIDVRAGAQLLQRAGLADPVADTRTIAARFDGLASLIEDLRAQGLTNALAMPGPPLGKAARARARAAFAAAGGEGRTSEDFEIVTLSGWRR